MLFSQISYFADITAHTADLLTPRALPHHTEQLSFSSCRGGISEKFIPPGW